MMAMKKTTRPLVYCCMSIYLLMTIYRTCVQKYRSLFTALIGSKISLKMLYDAMIHSHIVYCINVNVYGCANQTSLQKFKVKQKEAIRTISNVGYREHTNPLFKQLKILPIDKLIKFSNLKFMHNYAHGCLPLSFAEMWITTLY